MKAPIRIAILVSAAIWAAGLSHAANWADQYTATNQKNAEYWKERCELDGKILKNDNGEDFIRAITKCDGKERHDDLGFYYPRGGPHTPDHRCKLINVVRVDKNAVHLFETCKYHESPRGPLLIQFTGENILITNSENF
jgi:hypothetical protein